MDTTVTSIIFGDQIICIGQVWGDAYGNRYRIKRMTRAGNVIFRTTKVTVFSGNVVTVIDLLRDFVCDEEVRFRSYTQRDGTDRVQIYAASGSYNGKPTFVCVGEIRPNTHQIKHNELSTVRNFGQITGRQGPHSV
jgi:hypothetical protein